MTLPKAAPHLAAETWEPPGEGGPGLRATTSPGLRQAEGLHPPQGITHTPHPPPRSLRPPLPHPVPSGSGTAPFPAPTATPPPEQDLARGVRPPHPLREPAGPAAAAQRRRPQPSTRGSPQRTPAPPAPTSKSSAVVAMAAGRAAELLSGPTPPPSPLHCRPLCPAAPAAAAPAAAAAAPPPPAGNGPAPGGRDRGGAGSCARRRPPLR